MINWEIDEPEIMEDTVELYNDENEEQDFECSKMLLVKHIDDSTRKNTFSKGYYVEEKDEWYDVDGMQIFQVSGWYDLESEINIES